MPTKKKASPRRPTAIRRVARRVSRTARRVSSYRGSSNVMGQKIHWLKALLFFGGGWYLKPALRQTGIPDLLYTMSPQYQQFVNTLLVHNPDAAGHSGEPAIATTAGLGAFAKVLYESQKDGSIKGVDSLLPFALGAMADPEPGQEMFGQNQYTSSRWYS